MSLVTKAFCSLGTKHRDCSIHAIVLDAYVRSLEEHPFAAFYTVLQWTETMVRCVPYIVYRKDKWPHEVMPSFRNNLVPKDVFPRGMEDLRYRAVNKLKMVIEDGKVPPAWHRIFEMAALGLPNKTVTFGIELDVEPDRWSVCALVHGTDEYKQVAVILADGQTITQIETDQRIRGSLKMMTQQLCKDFWRDAWFGDMWEKQRRGRLGYQRAMCRTGTTPSESDLFKSPHAYRYGFQGVL